ncbi:MAG: hypothetical protein J6U20_00485 [Fibrobacter sp.]|nr:hypothetical protein [Fibrobacter sp.]
MNKPKIIATFPLTTILIIVSFIAALLCTGCSGSDNLAGTAEEPNELAYQDQPISSSKEPDAQISSSSERVKNSSSSSEKASSSSSSKEPAKPKSSSSVKDNDRPDTSSSAPASSSSSEKPPQGIQPPDENDKSSSSSVPSSSSFKDPGDGDTHSPPQSSTPENPLSLSDYIAIFGLEDMPFDTTVMASIATKEDTSSPQQPPAAQTSEFDRIGVHQFVKQNIYALSDLFPIAAKQYKELAAAIANDSAECGLYLLNIRGSSENVGHLLTKVTPDSMTVVDIVAPNCMTNTNGKLVRFLFSYCGDMSRDPEIVRTSVISDVPMNKCPDRLTGNEWVK